MRPHSKILLLSFPIVLCSGSFAPGGPQVLAAHSSSPSHSAVCAPSHLRLSPASQSTVWNWLNCEECTSDQLKAVVKLGTRVVPVLQKFLCNGATSAQMSISRHFLFQDYKELSEFQQTLPNAPKLPSEHDYVKTHLIHLSVQYQIRAATALGVIGSPQAIQALKNSLTTDLPDTVRSVVKEILGNDG